MLLRSVRLVPVGVAAPDGSLDVRIRDGLVREVAPRLRPESDEDVLDADGRWAMPGLWDAHVHLDQWAAVSRRLDVSGTRSAGEVISLVAAHLAHHPLDRADAVVIGYGYRSGTWPQEPTVAELDAVTDGRPVVLVSGDAHNGWLSSTALALFGIAPRVGALDEDDWFPVLGRLDSVVDDGRTEAKVGGVVAEAAARGVVGIVDMEFGSPWRSWPERFERGVDQLRVRAATYPDRLDDVITAGLRTGDALDGDGGLLTMGPLKVISDGSVNTRTAWCSQPYAGSEGWDHPCGKQNVSTADLTRLLQRARAYGLEAAVHAIGDAAVTSALDAFTASGASGTLEHAQLVAPGDAARAARLGVRASVQPAHLWDDRDVSARCWPDRTDRCFPLRSLLDAGVTLALGSDAPVAALDPWLAMAAAVYRSGDDREPWHPAQSLTVAQALAASTDGQQTISPGSRSDVVLLDDDPLQPQPDTAAAAAHLQGMHVAATLVAGRVAHLAP